MSSVTSSLLVLKPRLLAARNRWRRRKALKTVWMRNSVVLILTAVITTGSYLATLWVLEQTHTQLDFAYLHPRVFLGLILVFLFGMLLLTNTASALGALYMARDLTLLMASPLSPPRFFFGKWLEVMFSSSWMTMVFLAPVVVGFGAFFEGGTRYVLFSLLGLIPFFAIPAFLAMIISTLIAALIPANRKKELLLFLGIIIAFGLYWFTRLAVFAVNDGTPIDFTDVLKVVSFLSLTNVAWSPSHWTANVLGEALEPGGVNWRGYTTLLYCVTIFLGSAAYITLRCLHFLGYSRAALGKKSSKLDSRRSQIFYSYLFSRLDEPTRALVVKEVKSAARDITQSVQAILLLGLCGLYVYLLNFQHLFQQALPFGEERWWRLFLIITNICLEAFVITAMATRMAFPSISREGQSYWVLQSAPLDPVRFLRIKFFTWLIPIALITCLVFGASSWILHSSVQITVIKVLFNIVQCVGLVGMAIGFGCYFLNLNWEHPSELMASFGSMIYMLCAVSLILLNLSLAGIAVVLASSWLRDPSGRLPALGGCLLAAGMVILINVFLARKALSYGARFLRERQ